MSWAVSVGSVPAQPVQDIRDACNDALAKSGYTLNDEAAEQFEFAVETAVEAAKAHLLHAPSDDNAKLNINLSGHANPDHGDIPGTSNDALYISITRAYS